MESIDTEEMDYDTCLIMQEILNDEIDDEEFFGFAINNLSEMMWYIAGEMWFTAGKHKKHLHLSANEEYRRL